MNHQVRLFLQTNGTIVVRSTVTPNNVRPNDPVNLKLWDTITYSSDDGLVVLQFPDGSPFTKTLPAPTLTDPGPLTVINQRPGFGRGLPFPVDYAIIKPGGVQTAFTVFQTAPTNPPGIGSGSVPDPDPKG